MPTATTADFCSQFAGALINDRSALPCRISDDFPQFPGSGQTTGQPKATRVRPRCGRIGDLWTELQMNLDMRKGGAAGHLIFSDAFPAEITRAG
jgi:hypothetical protein